MLVKYSYPVVTSLLLDEAWPISWGRYYVQFRITAGRVDGIVVTVRPSAPDEWIPPSVTAKPALGVAANINVGSPPLYREVEELLRTLQGVLGLFSHVEIDFSRQTIEWEPENDEEREQLNLHSISRKKEKPDIMEPIRLAYDLIARCILSAQAASHFEIPLSFLRKGLQEIYNERYIEAYYSFFFFLETLFAPGLSNPRMVKLKFKEAAPVRNALVHTKRIGWHGPGVMSAWRRYCAMLAGYSLNLRASANASAARPVSPLSA
jgi:hypothetical protein